ncbi:MAG: ATP-binding protein [Rhodospirillaceae bacterium]|nr:ATP-binding protein [Rhodospirillaceae bacterium]
MADTLQFKQVVLNLLSNAVKYNRREGKVVVRPDRSGKFVRISVADTGHGIPSEMFENIFKPFNRLGREAGNIEGSGVGLTLTRKMVKKLQGEIGFESAEGEGSTFWVLLPSVAEPQSEGRV